MSWPILRIGALALPSFAAAVEMRYLWDTPHALDNRKLLALLGAEPHRPLVQAASMALHDPAPSLKFTRRQVNFRNPMQSPGGA